MMIEAHSALLLRFYTGAIPSYLPIVIEIVDDESKLRSFLASLEGLTDVGLVTLQAVEVLHYDGGKPLSS